MEKLMSILKDVRPDVDFQQQTKLIDDGILDSFDIISIVSEICDAFDVMIDAEYLEAENFNSAGAMMLLIQKLLNEE